VGWVQTTDAARSSAAAAHCSSAAAMHRSSLLHQCLPQQQSAAAVSAAAALSAAALSAAALSAAALSAAAVHQQCAGMPDPRRSCAMFCASLVASRRAQSPMQHRSRDACSTRDSRLWDCHTHRTSESEYTQSQRAQRTVSLSDRPAYRAARRPRRRPLPEHGERC